METFEAAIPLLFRSVRSGTWRLLADLAPAYVDLLGGPLAARRTHSLLDDELQPLSLDDILTSATPPACPDGPSFRLQSAVIMTLATISR